MGVKGIGNKAMNQKVVRSLQEPAKGNNPYEKLFVFEIEGIAKPASGTFQYDYLGCWKEGSYSFLFFTSNKKADVDAFIAKNSELSIRSEMILK